MSRLFAIFLALVSISAPALAEVLTPADAIRLSDRRPAFGTYSFTVVATGSDKDGFYLNSTPDYRSPENLTVALRMFAIQDLKKIYGEDLGAVFQGKTIWVRGEARRVPIAYVVDGRLTDRGYFQHHVNVTRAGQISFTAPSD